MIFGAHDAAIALVLGDTMWSKYALGARYGMAHTSNVFATDAAAENPKGASVEALTARGVRFLVCQRTLNRLAGNLAADPKELAQGLLPGVTIVPAMIVAANRAQEAGLAYTCLG